MEEGTGSEVLNVVIERLSEICSESDNKPDSDDVDNRSVASQTPAVSVLQVNTPKPRNPASSPNTSPTKKDLPVFKCEECDYSSHNKHYLKQHVDLVHSTDRPFKCPFCDYAGKRSYALKEHLIVHSNDRPFECTHCNATFRKKGHLTNHIKMHASQWNFDCSICHTTYATRDALYEHVGKHANDDGDVFACELCLYATLDRALIFKHIESGMCSGNVKTLKCDTCSFTTTEEEELSDHKAAHTIEGTDQSTTVQLKCSQCGFVSKKQEVLENHIIKKHLHKKVLTTSKSNLKSSNLPTSKSTLKSSDLPTSKRTLKSSDLLPTTTPVHAPKNKVKANTQPQVHNYFLCNVCGFTSNDAQSHLNHMSTAHKSTTTPFLTPILPQIPPKNHYLCNICGLTSNDIQSLTQHMTAHISRQMNPKQLIPNQSENTCLNPESAKFSYDAALRIFRCSICGYTCEHQRTIKSHIWKHSGHKDVGYPMFQNGPLSIYDDVTTGMKTQEVTQMNIVPGGAPIKTPPVMPAVNTLETKQSAPVTMASNTVVTPSFPGIVMSSVATPAMTSSMNNQSPSTSSSSISQQIKAVTLPSSGNVILSELLKQQSVVVVPAAGIVNKPEYQLQTIVNKNSHADTTTNATVPPGYSENGLNITNMLAGTPNILQDCTQVVVLDINQSQLQRVISETNMSALSNVVIMNQSMEGDGESQPESCPNGEVEIAYKRKLEDLYQVDDENEAKRSRVDNIEGTETSEKVVVEDVNDSCPIPDLNLRSSPRVLASDEVSDASSVTSEHEVIFPVPAGITVVEPAPESQGNVDVSSSDDGVTQSLPSGEKVDRVNVTRIDTNAHQQKSVTSEVSDGVSHPGVEVVVTTDSESVSRCTRSSTGISRDLPVQSNKSGISSSLLAVIEQLRERSKSDSDHEESEPAPPCPPKVQPASRVTKRSRSKRTSTDDPVDIESYPNVEKLDHESGMYRCKLCHYKSCSTNLMKQHMRLHKSKQPFECSLCDFIAEASEALQDHMLQHCKIRTYQCKLCPSTFNYKSQLRAHMRAHNETEPFTCDVCEFETFNPILFRNHAKTHKEKGYHCKDCNAVYTEKCEDENHEKEELRSVGNLYCDECGLILQSREDLKKHQKSHIKQLRCEQCNFSCSTLGRMRNHCRLHLDDKPMQCSLCDFTAISTRSLKSHMKRHINDQRYVQQPLEQYKCNLCGYVCHHLPSLKSHMWRHASETGYSYQDANDAINAAIDYENNMIQPMKLETSREDTDEDTDANTENVQVLASVKELLDSQNVGMKGKSDSSTLVTFRCCECGFESVSRVQLTAHMKQHTDIITKTLEINQCNNYRKFVPSEGSRDLVVSVKK
jgi:hypothetical protein